MVISQEINPLISTLERRDHLSAQEREMLVSLPMRRQSYENEAEVIREGSRPTESCLVLDGFCARAKYFEDGSRQLTAVHVPGDFVDLHGFLLKVMDHSVMALGPCTVGFIPHADILETTRASEHLARLLWLSTTIDGAIQRTWIACLGRRSAAQSFAHLICELYLRLEVIGRARDGTFEFPATQTVLGDLLGLSTVHVNRKLRELRSSGTIRWEGRVISIHDFEALAEFAGFDATYLNLLKVPR